LLKRTRGITGNYLIDNYGDPMLSVDGSGRRVLGYRITQTIASVVTLQISADDIQFVVNTYVVPPSEFSFHLTRRGPIQ
jgi:hypothetical protein